MRLKLKITSAILMLLSAGGCAGQYKHPTFYERQNIQYVSSSDCRELEKSYAIALAWEKNANDRIFRKILLVIFPRVSITLAHLHPDSFLISPQQQNEKFLKETKELFLKKGCSTVGYVALKDGDYAYKVNSCTLDEKTGFHVCIRNK